MLEFQNIRIGMNLAMFQIFTLEYFRFSEFFNRSIPFPIWFNLELSNSNYIWFRIGIFNSSCSRKYISNFFYSLVCEFGGKCKENMCSFLSFVSIITQAFNRDMKNLHVVHSKLSIFIIGIKSNPNWQYKKNAQLVRILTNKSSLCTDRLSLWSLY